MGAARPGRPDAARRLAGLINHPAIEAANRQAFAAYQAAQPVLEGSPRAPCPRWASARSCTRVRRSRGSGCAVRRARSSAPSCTRAGAQPCGRGGAGAARRGSSSRRATPRRGRADGRRDQRLDAGLDRGRPRARQRAYCNFNEGLGKVLRFGANSPEVIERLRWMAAVLAPALRRRARAPGRRRAEAADRAGAAHGRRGAQPQRRRLVAAAQAPGAGAAAHRHRPADVAAVVEFIAGNDHFFLNLSMAACKAMLDAAAGAEQQHGDRDVAERGRLRHPPERHRRGLVHRAGAGGRRPVLSGYSAADAARPRRQRDHRDRGSRRLRHGRRAGDRAVRRRHAAGRDREHRRDEPHHARPQRRADPAALDFAGTPAGIDARKVVDTGIAPIINTGIAHREAGIGQIGAGITRAPLACFAQAIVALADRVAD